MPRILVLLQAGDAYASGTIRALIYRDHFRRVGAQVSYASIQLPSLVRLKERVPTMALKNGVAVIRTGLAAVNGLRVIRKAKNYDVVYMSKVSSHLLVGQLRKHSNARLVLDFGDALWSKRSGVSKFNQTLALVDAVTTDNEHTAEHVRRFQPSCTVIPDTPQLELFDQYRGQLRRRDSTDRVILGWIGSRSTVFGLFAIWEALERLFEKHDNLHLRIVGAGHDRRLLPPFAKVRFSVVPGYKQTEMVKEVMAMDIGLFPLHDVEDSRARGVLKACVYMAGEAAVIASPIGQNNDLIENGVNGLLAKTTGEWVERLERLVLDADLRRRLVVAGLETVRTSFTTEKSFEKLYSVLVPSEA